MKIQILQENLLKSLSRVGRVISSRSQLPVLQNVLITATKEGVSLAASNMEMSMIVRVNAKTEKEGSVCVSGKLLTELVTSLPHEAVFLEEKEGSLLVSTAKTHASLSETPVTEFPQINTTGSGEKTAMEPDVVVDAIGSVLYAASSDEGRPTLTGVKIETTKEETSFVATDGYRLSLKKVSFQKKTPTNMIVPSRALGEIIKSLSEEKNKEPVIFEKTTDGQLLLSVGDTGVVSRLIEGDYPDYARIIPKTHTTKATADKSEFLLAVKSASIFARDNANIVKLLLSKEGITVSANAPQVGQNTVDVDAVVEGDDTDIAFNSRFLLEFLNNFPDDEVVFEMTGSLNPGVFKSKKDALFLHIIMPVRVQG
jgi:DNA polymerase III subunit beta